MATNIVCLTTIVEVLCERLLRGDDRNLETEEATLWRGAFLGVHGARETPVPIPNTAVKPSSGYNTWVLALGK